MKNSEATNNSKTRKFDSGVMVPYDPYIYPKKYKTLIELGKLFYFSLLTNLRIMELKLYKEDF